jgi:hypothetical protein
MLVLDAGYVQRGRHKFPKEASVAPWRLHQNYALDVIALRYASVQDDVMSFERVDASAEDADELAAAGDALSIGR